MALPAALALIIGGTVLSAGAALAAEPEAVVTSAPTASATTQASPTPSPAATASTSPSAVPTAPAPSATAPATAAPKAGAAKAAPPTRLTAATVPVADEDGYVRITGDRDVTITGTAPIGARVVVTDSWGEPITRLTTTSTSFSIPLHFADDAGYQQYLSVYATATGKDLGEYDFFVEFDAEQSATPAITDPAADVTYEASPFPFSDGEPLALVEFTGTGVPGNDIYLYGMSAGDGSGDEFSSGGYSDAVSVGDDGTWTADYYVAYGVDEVAAIQVETNDEGDEVTRESEPSASIDVTVTVPPGTVLPPTVLAPTYDDSFVGSVSFGFSSSASASSGTASASTKTARTQAQKRKARAVRAEDPSPSSESSSRASALPRAVRALADEAGDTDAEFEKSLDELIDEIGIPVSGRGSAATPGELAMTVSGTGTPGHDIVLYEERPLTSLDYFVELYPSLFSGDFEPEVLNADASSGARELRAPRALSGDPASTTPLPVDDGSIVVAADGTWSTTLARTPGNYILTAFQVDPAATGDAAYSVPSDLRFIHLTGTPYAAPGVVPAQLAFTGTSSGPQALVGVGVLGLGVVLLVVARRRRRSGAAASAEARVALRTRS